MRNFLPKENRVGLYVTISVHLVVVIVFLAARLGFALRKEDSFVLDFSKVEQLEQLQRELAFQQQINDRLNEMLESAGVGSEPVRAVAVDRSGLRDDRGTDAEELYRDAERLQQALDRTFSREESDGFASVEQRPVEKEKDREKEDGPKYSGPSVVSYDLGGRKASSLNIPAYRCMGAGRVKVLITVDNAGKVTGAKVDEEGTTSDDSCLRNFAVRAARLSRFSADSKAPAKHQGNIVYEFIAQ